MESEGHSIDPRLRGIAENRDVLVETLDVNHVLLTELEGHEILDECTKQRITSEKNYDINERFITWLETRSSQTIDIVLQKLRDDKQGHVANLIDGTDGERPLSAKAKQRIRKLSGWLTKNMTTDHGLIEQLLSLEAISSRDCEDIKAKPTESARATELINVILRRSDKTMKIFQEALMTSNQRHIAEVLEKDEMIELCLRHSCKSADPNLLSSPKADKDEELQHKLKTVFNQNFALAVVKTMDDVIIYVLCDDGDDRRMLEGMFESSQHRAILVEEFIKLATSDTRAWCLLESDILQLLQEILPNVGHSGFVLQTGANCGQRHELDSFSESTSLGLKKSCLTDDNKKEEQKLISCKPDHVVKSKELVFEVDKRSHDDSESHEKDKRDLGRKVDLCKTEDTKITKKSDDIEMTKFCDNMCKEMYKAEHGKSENLIGLTVDDGTSEESTDSVIQELQLKLKLAAKERDRKSSEITQLQERLRQVEEEKEEIDKDLDEFLKLGSAESYRVIIELKQKVRQVEKEKDELSKDLKEAAFAHQKKKKDTDLKGRGNECSFNPQNFSFLEIFGEIRTEENEGAVWAGLKRLFDLAAAAVTLNRQCNLYICLLILRNTKSRKEAIYGFIMISLLLLPLLLHLPVGIPENISSFCFSNISSIFWGCLIITIPIILILEKKPFMDIAALSSLLVLFYLSSDGFVPGVGVRRYCQEDKCVYMFCWDYLSHNMRIGHDAFEQSHYTEADRQQYSDAGGLFKSPAAFAVWKKYTSDRWDKEISEYTQDGEFLRKVYTKPLMGTASFHGLTAFRLSTGLVSVGHGSFFYDDPMLRLCLLDANGNITQSFGGQYGPGNGVPAVLDVDREGCVIVADRKSGKRMAICSDEDRMKQLQAKIHELDSPFEMCLHSRLFD